MKVIEQYIVIYKNNDCLLFLTEDNEYRLQYRDSIDIISHIVAKKLIKESR